MLLLLILERVEGKFPKDQDVDLAPWSHAME